MKDNYDFVKRQAKRLAVTKQAIVQVDGDNYKFTMGLKSITVTPEQSEELYYFIRNNVQ
jgi:hypothetical protein